MNRPQICMLVSLAALAYALACGTPGPADAATSCSRFVAPNGVATNSGLTPSSPLPLRTAAGAAVAGQTVCLLAGTYPLSSTLYLSRSGLRGNPIVYRGGYNGTAVLRWAGPARGGAVVEFGSGVHDVELRQLVVNGANGSALAQTGVHCDDYAYDVAVRFSTIENTGAAGVNTKRCDYVTVEGSKIFHTGYDPLAGWSSAISFNSNVWADRNAGFHSYVVDNVVSGASDESSAHTEGHAFISDLGGSVPPVLIANNVFFENGRWCVNLYGSQHTWVVNNTCYADALDGRAGASGEFMNHDSSAFVASDNHFVNNVAFAWTGRYPYKLVSGSATYQHNVAWGGLTSVLPASILTDASRVRKVNPAFSNPFTLDPTRDQQQKLAPAPWTIGTRFRPKLGSPLIDGGIDPRQASGMTVALRQGITRYALHDITGVARPQGASFDVGAYEGAG